MLHIYSTRIYLRNFVFNLILLYVLFNQINKSYFFTACMTCSGVQRLLAARGQRGSWIPSKIFSIRPAKFLTPFFYQLSNFRTIRSLDAPPVLHHVPVTTFFSSSF